MKLQKRFDYIKSYSTFRLIAIVNVYMLIYGLVLVIDEKLTELSTGLNLTSIDYLAFLPFLILAIVHAIIALLFKRGFVKTYV